MHQFLSSVFSVQFIAGASDVFADGYMYDMHLLDWIGPKFWLWIYT